MEPILSREARTAVFTFVTLSLVLINVFQFYRTDHLIDHMKAAEADILKFRRSVDREVAELRVRDFEPGILGQPGAPAGNVDPAMITDPIRRIAAAVRQQQRALRQMKADIAKLEAGTNSANGKLSTVDAEVNALKAGIARTSIAMDRSLADLQSAVGDLTVQSQQSVAGLKELDALRETAEREYFEFQIRKDRNGTRVSDVSILLKKTDPAKNKFTLQLTTEESSIEHKDRNLHEPIQFYVHKGGTGADAAGDVLHELVVNEIHQDRVAGYLAV